MFPHRYRSEELAAELDSVAVIRKFHWDVTHHQKTRTSLMDLRNPSCSFFLNNTTNVLMLGQQLYSGFWILVGVAQRLPAMHQNMPAQRSCWGSRSFGHMRLATVIWVVSTHSIWKANCSLVFARRVLMLKFAPIESSVGHLENLGNISLGENPCAPGCLEVKINVGWNT